MEMAFSGQLSMALRQEPCELAGTGFPDEAAFPESILKTSGDNRTHDLHPVQACLLTLTCMRHALLRMPSLWIIRGSDGQSLCCDHTCSMLLNDPAALATHCSF
jgi:hypothetical protein